jgi:hypothetical protein
MQDALGRRAASNVATGARGGEVIRPDDVRRTATVLVETDPNNPNLIRRIRHQTFRVQDGRVRQNVRTVFHGPQPVSIQTARNRGWLDRIRHPGGVPTSTGANPRFRSRIARGRIAPRRPPLGRMG